MRRERGFTIDDMPIHAFSEEASAASSQLARPPDTPDR
jgi:hypothetical protein